MKHLTKVRHVLFNARLGKSVPGCVIFRSDGCFLAEPGCEEADDTGDEGLSAEPLDGGRAENCATGGHDGLDAVFSLAAETDDFALEVANAGTAGFGKTAHGLKARATSGIDVCAGGGNTLSEEVRRVLELSLDVGEVLFHR